MSLRVVLADDHVVLRQGVRALLERHGFEVVAEASDGRTAVEVTRQHEPNVAVLDIMMPLLNGDRKSTRLNSSHSQISYAVFCLKKKNKRLAAALLSSLLRDACAR